MNVAVMATMGTSPPIVTKFIDYLQKTERVSHLSILATKERSVVNGAPLVKATLKSRFPSLKVDIHQLAVADTTNEDENYQIMEESAKIITGLKRRYPVLHICLAGGRKETVASTITLAQLMGLTSLYHVVSPNIREMNIELERIRKEIEEFGESSDPQKYYEEKKNLFEPVLFPSASSYNVIKLPIIPYPASSMTLLRRLLGSSGEKVEGVDKSFLKRLKLAGLITFTKDGKIVVTTEGNKLYNHLIRHIF
ncbi:MAG: CRISPR-associated ring nuclease [Candidatus Bathyarchaeia archaeon]